MGRLDRTRTRVWWWSYLLLLLARAASDETCASGAHNSSLEPAVLPVLDLAPFAAISTTPTSAQRAVAAALDAAARDHGFVALKNLADRELLDRAWNASAALFAMDDSSKARLERLTPAAGRV